MPLNLVTLIALVIQAAATPSVWDRVYTAAQADRGRTIYEQRCGRCHAADLRGVSASPLAGEGFLLHWEGRTVERLFRKIAYTMPPDAPGTLAERATLDVIAYVLQQNHFPDGSTGLDADPAALAALEIRSSADRPAVVRQGSLVEAIGCLAQSPDESWLLTNSTEPQITTLEAPRPGRDSSPVGASTRQIALMNVFPQPAAHKGHTMWTKGFLIRAATGDRINVVTMEMLDSQCQR